MAIFCPNFKSKEWIDLVAEVGSRDAIRAYYLNEQDIPSPEYAKEILANGVVSYNTASNPIEHNDIVKHKIISEQLETVNEYLKQISKRDEVVETDNSLTIGGYVINVNNVGKTREELEQIVDNEHQRLIDESEVLNEILSSLDVDTSSTEYKNAYPNHSITDLNDNPIGITSKPIGQNYSPRASLNTVKGLQETFAKLGIYVDVIEDFTMSDSGNIVLLNGIPTIRFNPNKIQGDTVYHEFGHLYIDLLGYESPLIKAGISQLLDTKLAKAIRVRNPELGQEKFEKELLTTAIGMNASDLISNPETLAKWNFWLNRVFRGINELINKITNGRFGEERNVAKELAADLVNQTIGKSLTGTLSDYMQHQVSEPLAYSRAVESGLAMLETVIRDTNTRIGIWRSNAQFVERSRQMIGSIDMTNLIIKKDLGDVGSALGTALTFTYNDMQRIQKNLDHYHTQFFVKKIPFENLTPKQQTDVNNALYGTRVFMDTFSKISDVRTMLQDHIDELNDNIEIMLAESAKLTGDEKAELDADIDATIKYVEDMVEYFDNVNALKLSIDSRMSDMIQSFHDLLPIAIAHSMRYSTNPVVTNDAIAAITKTYQDSSWVARQFDSLLKSTNPIAANLANVIRVTLGIKESRVGTMQREYYEARLGVNDSDLDLFLDKDKRLTQKYDLDQFNDELTAALSKIVASGFKYSPRYYRAMSTWIRNNTKIVTDPKTGLEYTEEGFNDLIAERAKTMSKEAYIEWRDSNFSLKGKHTIAKYTGEYSSPMDKFIQPKYLEIQRRPEFVKFYNTLKNIMTETTSAYNIPQGKGILPARRIGDEADSTEIEKGDDIKIGIGGERQFQLSFKHIGLLNRVELITIPTQHKGEHTADYNYRALAIINNSGQTEGKHYRDLRDVVEENTKRYRKSVEQHGAAVETNLDVVIPDWIDSALSYKYKHDIQGEVENLLYKLKTDAVTEYSYLTGKDKTSAEKDLQGNKIVQKFPGSTSNIYNQAFRSVEMHFYDHFREPSKYDNPLIKLKNYSSFLGIGFNMFANTKNITQGGFMSAAEAMAGVFFENSNLRWAQGKYFSGTTSYFADANVFERKKGDPRKASSKQNAFFKQIPIIRAYNDLMERVTDDKISKAYALRMAESAAYLGQEIGEHMMQNTLYLAMMDSHRLIKVDGRYRLMTLFDYTNLQIEQTSKSKDDAENHKIMAGNVETKARLKAEFEANPKFYDIYDFNEDTGFNELTETYANLNKTDKASLDEAVAQFQLRAIAVSHEIHGVYNKADKGNINHTVLGELLIQFKAWMRPGWTKRFGYDGGIFKVKPTWDESSQSQNVGAYKALGKFLFSNPISDETKAAFATKNAEGIAKGLANVVTDYLKFIGSVKIYWHMMTPVEQAGARRAAAEFAALGIAFALLIGGMKFRNRDDKRKKLRALNFLLYQLDASRMELLTFIPVFGWANQGKQLLTNPAATWGTMANIAVLMGDLVMYPIENAEQRVFQGGNYRDQLKIAVHAKKILPGANILQRWDAMDKQFQAYKMIGNIGVGDIASGSPEGSGSGVPSN